MMILSSSVGIFPKWISSIRSRICYAPSTRGAFSNPATTRDVPAALPHFFSLMALIAFQVRHGKGVGGVKGQDILFSLCFWPGRQHVWQGIRVSQHLHFSWLHCWGIWRTRTHDNSQTRQPIPHGKLNYDFKFGQECVGYIFVVFAVHMNNRSRDYSHLMVQIRNLKSATSTCPYVTAFLVNVISPFHIKHDWDLLEKQNYALLHKEQMLGTSKLQSFDVRISNCVKTYVSLSILKCKSHRLSVLWNSLSRMPQCVIAWLSHT